MECTIIKLVGCILSFLPFSLFVVRFLRAVAYRWLVPWICGYLGWDNARPLSACVYHYVRNKYHSAQAHGYQSAQHNN